MKAIGLLKYFKTKKGTTYKMMCKVSEAIAELQALEILANRGCNGCKYEKVLECEKCIYCKTNCLDRWESK